MRRRRRATDMSHLVDPDPDYPSDSEEEEGEEEEEEQQQQQPPIDDTPRKKSRRILSRFLCGAGL